MEQLTLPHMNKINKDNSIYEEMTRLSGGRTNIVMGSTGRHR